MTIILDERLQEHALASFHARADARICATLPQGAATAEEALRLWEASRLPGAASYGRIIRVDGRYAGDVWCYAIQPGGDPEAMLSYCVNDPALWGQGVAGTAVALFLTEVRQGLGLGRMGAICWADHSASRRVLEKNGFRLAERFQEGGREACYYLNTMEEA